MSRKRNQDEPRPRRSPTRTVADASDVFAEDLDIPDLPAKIPDRLSDAIRRRVEALLYQLDRAAHEQWLKPLEVRLVRDAHRAVLTAGTGDECGYYSDLDCDGFDAPEDCERLGPIRRILSTHGRRGSQRGQADGRPQPEQAPRPPLRARQAPREQGEAHRKQQVREVVEVRQEVDHGSKMSESRVVCLGDDPEGDQHTLYNDRSRFHRGLSMSTDLFIL